MGSKSRRRLSSSEDVVDREEEEEVDPADNEPSNPPRRKKKKKSSRAAEDQDEDDDSSNKENFSSPLRSINTPGKPPEAGVIKRVYVENFMCHRKLTVDLCRNVNFIHGQNGSGKSAILAAVQICLGAGARRTHRARNLKELIRKEAGSNCSWAKVRVTLLNKGEDGFQQDVYGETITVERCISKSGGYNGYKLLDHNGKERSRSKKDLDAMLDQLNIQVENPVAVLDQEEAKKFLMGKPEDKYAFFMKATELERLDKTYENIVDNLDDWQAKNDKVKLSLDGAVQNVRTLKKEWEKFQELDKLEAKIVDHQFDSVWALYNERETEFQKAQQALEQARQKREKRQKDLEAAQAANTAGEDEEQIKKDRMAELTEEATEAAAAKTEMEAELKRAEAPLKAKQRELSNLARDQQKAKKQLNLAQKYLQETRDQILAASGSAKSEEARRTQLLQEAERDLAEAKEAKPHKHQAQSESLREYENLEPVVKHAKDATGSKASQVAAVKSKIQQLQSSQGNSMAMFGQKCHKVHELVEQACKRRKFRGKVIGPIGAHIKVAPGKENFAKIAELALGGSVLDRFIVTNNEDRRLLMKIRCESGCRSQECGIFQMFDGRRHPVPPPPVEDVETVASALQIADDLVFNTLVDNCRIDSTALSESKESGERALLMESNGVYSIRGGKINKVYFLPNGDFWAVKNGGKSMVSNERQLRQSIGVDKSAVIAQAKREVEGLQQELDDLRDKEADVIRQSKNAKIKWNNDMRARRQCDDLITSLTSKVEELKTELAEAEEEDSTDTTELEEDVANAEQMVDDLKQQGEAIHQEIEDLEPATDEIKKRLEEVSTRNERVLAELETAEQELHDYYQSLEQRQSLVEKKRAKLEQAEQILKQFEETADENQKARDKVLRTARILTYRREQDILKEASQDADMSLSMSASPDEETPPPDDVLEAIEPKKMRKGSSYYRTKMQRAREKLAEEKERRSLDQVDPEVVYQKYQRAQADLNSKYAEINNIEANIEQLTKDMSERRKRWKQFRKHIVQMTNNSFDEMLNKKGSSGELVFDHESHTLELLVQKDNMNEMSQTSDVKALSGGERSFTTLCLLLALGEQLETPFRVMDEFDVFMDPVARKIALTTLVTMSKDTQHRQFIFITPQDLSTLDPDPMLKIFKMKPPARNVNVGGPSQQILEFGSQESN